MSSLWVIHVKDVSLEMTERNRCVKCLLRTSALNRVLWAAFPKLPAIRTDTLRPGDDDTAGLAAMPSGRVAVGSDGFLTLFAGADAVDFLDG